jgi:ferredoxin-NADP reductase
VTAFAAGSGITPIFSIIKHTLHAHTRPVRLLYANRDRGSAIFRSQLDGLVERHPERLAVEYHEDVVNGFVDQTRVAGFSSGATSTTYLVCGPAEFMDVVVSGLSQRGTRPEQVRIERFSPPDTEPADLPAPGTTDAPCVEVTIELGGRKVTVPYRPRTTVLQTARSAGFSAPSSCETGTCATCMARVLEGQVVMRNNEALTQEEVAEGWVLTCQSLPTSETLSVIYE